MYSQYHYQLGASFWVIGSDMSPDELTSRLGIKPEYAFSKGAPRLNKKRGIQVGIHRENNWGFSSPALPDNPYIDAHLSYILAIVEPHTEFLLSISDRAELFLEIQCTLDDHFKSTSYVIDNSFLSRLNKLKVNVGFVFKVVKNEHP
jgi:hypothetical protein